MQAFMKSFPFILSFLVGVILFMMTFGPDVTTKFLLLVLLSMLVVNATKVTAFLKSVANF